MTTRLALLSGLAVFYAQSIAQAQLEIAIRIDSAPILSVSGPMGTVSQVQWTDAPEDTIRWFHLGHVELTDGEGSLTDLGWPSNSWRFYRAVGVPSTNLVLVPAGTFQMGDNFAEGNPNELPVHSVYVSAFFMDRDEVSKALWDEVYQWATNHNYTFDSPGRGEAGNHPVQGITWFDAMKWCNARSEREERLPAYWVGSVAYRTGSKYPSVDWRNGFRLPTEAEWEKAARGGMRRKRFSFGDTINHNQANYNSLNDYPYDLTPTPGYHPGFDEGTIAYTSPSRYFPDNGYGLYDMAGNVGELCGDFFETDYYASSPTSDPRGPSWGAYAVIRGGGWYEDASMCRVADRNSRFAWGGDASAGVGLRCVLPCSQQ